MRTLKKLNASECKSIVTNLYTLYNIRVHTNDYGHSKFLLNQTDDKLLIEALNQITTVECKYNKYYIETNYSRYLYKLQKAKTNNKIFFLRLINPIGLLFNARCNHTNIIYRFKSDHEYYCFIARWNKKYPDLIPTVINNNWHFDENIKSIITLAMDKYIINTTDIHKISKISIQNETFKRIDNLIVRI